MFSVLPQNKKFLRDAFGSALSDGACVLDADQEVGYVRLEFGSRRGPDSAYWDGWFTVTRTRSGPHAQRPPAQREGHDRTPRPADRRCGMTWHSTVVPAADLATLLDRIRDLGGTVTSSRPETGGTHVTWTTTSGGSPAPAPARCSIPPGSFTTSEGRTGRSSSLRRRRPVPAGLASLAADPRRHRRLATYDG